MPSFLAGLNRFVGAVTAGGGQPGLHMLPHAGLAGRPCCRPLQGLHGGACSSPARQRPGSHFCDICVFFVSAVLICSCRFQRCPGQCGICMLPLNRFPTSAPSPAAPTCTSSTSAPGKPLPLMKRLPEPRALHEATAGRSAPVRPCKSGWLHKPLQLLFPLSAAAAWPPTCRTSPTTGWISSAAQSRCFQTNIVSQLSPLQHGRLLLQ